MVPDTPTTFAKNDHPSDGSTSPSDFELIQFLWERAHEESSLFWSRNAVFTIMHPLALAGVFDFVINETGKPTYGVFSIMCASGAAFAAIWIWMTYRGRVYAHRYGADAMTLIRANPAIASRVPHMMKTRCTAADSKNLVQDMANIRHGEASTWMYVLGIWSLVAWMLLWIYTLRAS